MSPKAKVPGARAVSGKVSTSAHPGEERQSWFYEAGTGLSSWDTWGQTENSRPLGNL